MADKKNVICPLCGGQLLFCVKEDTSLRRKINKDGTLSKKLFEGPKILTDIYYLECKEYSCTFLYNLSYPENNKADYMELDYWYEKYGENFE